MTTRSASPRDYVIVDSTERKVRASAPRMLNVSTALTSSVGRDEDPGSQSPKDKMTPSVKKAQDEIKAEPAKTSIRSALQVASKLLNTKTNRKKKLPLGMRPSQLTSVASVSSGLKEMLRTGGTYKFVIRNVGDFGTDVAGIIQYVWPLNPSSSPEFSGLSALFDEFRVLKGKLHWFGRNRYSKVTTVSSFMSIAFDNDDSSNPVSHAELIQYSTWEGFNIDDPFTYHFHRPDVTPSAYWTDIGAPSGSAGGLKVWFESSSVSTVYGSFIMEWEIECRGRR